MKAEVTDNVAIKMHRSHAILSSGTGREKFMVFHFEAEFPVRDHKYIQVPGCVSSRSPFIVVPLPDPAELVPKVTMEIKKQVLCVSHHGDTFWQIVVGVVFDFEGLYIFMKTEGENLKACIATYQRIWDDVRKYMKIYIYVYTIRFDHILSEVGGSEFAFRQAPP